MLQQGTGDGATDIDVIAGGDGELSKRGGGGWAVPFAEGTCQLQTDFGIRIIREFYGGIDQLRICERLGKPQGVAANRGMWITQDSEQCLGPKCVEAIEGA